MFRRALAALALTLVALALTLTALMGALLAPRPWALDVGAPGDAYSVIDAYPAEQGDGGSLRWSRDSVGLRVPGAYIGESTLSLRLYREALPERGDAPWPLALAQADAPPARFDAPPGWRVYRVLLPPGASAGPLTLTGPTFQPGRGDPRDLGVAIDSLAVRPLPGAGVPLALALARVIWLTLALALAAAAGWLIDRWSLGVAGAAGRPRRAAGLVAGLGAALAAWAWLDPMSLACSMGIYVFNADKLISRLSEGSDDKPRIDFGKNVIPAMVAEDRVYAHRFTGYWVDVGTIQSYWETSMQLLDSTLDFDLFDQSWVIRTRSEERPPAKVGPQARVGQSIICNGCTIRGTVERSVLSPGVYVSPGAVVRDSVVMNDVWIGPGAVLDRVIVDKQVVVGAGARVGFGDDLTVPNARQPDKLTTGVSVIGKSAHIPPGISVGRNVVINADRDTEDFPGGDVASGETI
ncbi:glucose-1-phosphate adenylyltransferase family protein [Oscillochloris sp. ZM17-4]|uniref:glucose-1-phosphate adenylyltransferase family protein n=1 Tax=Oscillochloris sp. ZM17-4 TaxID=2866714 RepID=UPI0021074B0F|nr:sugar phosphate nucleotidyltransferase [Oscillochloris sp. ZM17-4]